MRLLAHPVHARPDALRRHRLVDLRPARRATSSSGPGPIFTNLLLADEINRAPPKTQAALLEAMQERQVTIEGETRPLAPPFLVLATQNPIEYEGTYPLPEAQLDRFLLRVGVGYPAREDEWRVLERRMERGEDEIELEPVVDRAHAARAAARRSSRCTSPSRSACYMVDLVAATRGSTRVQVGREPARHARAAQARRAARRRSHGRDFVTPDDVKAVAVPALAHRLTLRPELWVQRVRGGRRRRGGAASGADAARRRLSARDDALATPKLAAYAGARRARARRPRSCSAGRSSSALAAPFAARARRRARRSRARRTSRPALERRPRARARGRGARRRRSRSTTRRAGRAARAPARRCRAGSRPSSRSEPARAAARRARSRARRGAGPLRALGRATGSARSLLRAHDRLGAGRPRRARRPARAAARLPAARGAPRPAAAARDAGLRRQPGRSRAQGEGIEFADLRQFVPGDRIRRINWRASARRARAVGERAAPGAERRRHPLPRHFRARRAPAAARRSTRSSAPPSSLADRYLRHKDRVGLVSFGGTLNWLLPATGIVQRYRIVDALLESEIVLQLRAGRTST